MIKQKGHQFTGKRTANEEKDLCPICLIEFEETDGIPIAELNCSEKHIFHVDCISEWINKNHY